MMRRLKPPPPRFFGEVRSGLLDQGVDGSGDAAREIRRADAHPEDDDCKRHQAPIFARIGVREFAVFLAGDFAEEDALIGPKQVAGGENHARRRPTGPGPVHLVGAEEDQELSHEAVEHRQAHGTERDEAEEGGKLRHGRTEAAVLADFEGMAAIVKHTDEEEKRAGGDAVGEHLINRALHGNRMEGEDAEDDESQVADGGVGDEFFQVRLHKRDERAIDDADDGQNGDPGGRAIRSLGEEREAEAHHAVGAHFQEHAGQNDGAGGGRLDVRVREPGMQREERHLDGEGQEKGEEEEHFRARRKMVYAGLQQRLNRRQVERASEVIEPQDADQHERGAEHGVDEEFYSGVDAAVVAPDADEEGHGDQHDFPEEEEEEEIEGEKDPDDADFEQKEHHVEFLDAVVHAIPGSHDAERREEGGEDDEEEADAVDAEVIVDRRGGDPGFVFDERVARSADSDGFQEDQ